MKTTFILSFALLCCVGAVAWAQVPAQLPTVADSYVHYGAPDGNFGDQASLFTSHSNNGTLSAAKMYLRFDASGLPPITELVSLNLYLAGWSNTQWHWHTFNVITQTGGSDVVWAEDGINWTNAPGNNVTGAVQDFVARAGEQVPTIGAFIKQGGTAEWKTLLFEEGVISEQDDPADHVAGIAALINALNTGDRTATIGIRWASSNSQYMEWSSKEGVNAPYLQVETADPYFYNFDPDNGDVVPVTQELSWDQPAGVAGQDIYYKVYWGTDPNTASPTFNFNLIKTTTDNPTDFFAAPALDFDMTYYWRVDAYDPNEPFTPYLLATGPLLQFDTLTDKAQVIGQPVSVTVAAGGNAQFSVTANNATTYQWFKDGSVVGGNTDTLTITNVQVANEGFYYCVVDNELGIPDPSDAAQLMTKRLVGWWKLDDNLSDSNPTAVTFNGQMTLTPAYLDGIDGKAIDLDGTSVDGLVDMPGSSDFYNFYPQGYTVSAWVKAPSPTGSWGSFVSKAFTGGVAGVGSHYGYALFYNTGGNAVFTQRQSFGDLQSGYQILDDAWHLVTGTWDASDGIGRIYVDGILRSQSGVQAALPPLPPAGEVGDVRIGAYAQVTEDLNSPYVGLVDDVRIYSYPLSAMDVAVLYTNFETDKPVCLDRPAFDISGPAGVPDCIVNLYDFLEIAATWLECGLVPESACNP